MDTQKPRIRIIPWGTSFRYTLTYQGVTDSLKGWGRRKGKDWGSILRGLEAGTSVDEALDPSFHLPSHRPKRQRPLGRFPGLELKILTEGMSADEYPDTFGVKRRPWRKAENEDGKSDLTTNEE